MHDEHSSLTPFWIGLALMVAGVALVVWSLHGSMEDVTVDDTSVDDETFCVQVVTPARNPATGLVVNYPTPCDVPEGWEVVVP